LEAPDFFYYSSSVLPNIVWLPQTTGTAPLVPPRSDASSAVSASLDLRRQTIAAALLRRLSRLGRRLHL